MESKSAKTSKIYHYIDTDQRKPPEVLNYLLALSEIHWQANADKLIFI